MSQILNPASFQRVSPTNTMSQLKLECQARGLKVSGSKTELMQRLTEGTISLYSIPEFQYIESVKALMKTELASKKALECAKNRQAQQNMRQIQMVQYEKERQNQEVVSRNRQVEVSTQMGLHNFSTICHRCPLAKTIDLKLNQISRVINATCDYCRIQNCQYSCEQCDWDICSDCLGKVETREKDRVKKETKRAHEIDRQKKLHTTKVACHDCLMALTSSLVKFDRSIKSEVGCSWNNCDSMNCHFSCEACDYHICLDCSVIAEKCNHKRKLGEDIIEFFYEDVVKNPLSVNLNEAKLLKYVVWTSCCYLPDGWHSYQGPPDIEFDSSYNLLAEANNRVEFKMRVDNPWGLPFDELEERNEILRSVDKNGFLSMEVCPDSSEEYKVSVVPMEAFPYLCKPNKYPEEQGDSMYGIRF